MSREPMEVIRQIPTWFWLAKRRIVPVGLLISIAWAILEFSKDRPGRAIYPCAFGAYFLFSYCRTRRGGAEIPEIPDEYRFYEVYGFFGGCFIVGVTFFVLAIFGVAHIGIVIGSAALVGAYFQYPNREAAPELSASTLTSVVPPPPPCVVPTIHRGASLMSVEQSIRSASCSVGKIRYTPSSSVHSGGVLGLSPATGTKLAPGAAVGIVVSAGRPCLVPFVKAGSSVGRARRLLAAGNCGAVIIHMRSRHVRRGQVVRLGSRAHSRLFPLSRVRIVVSKGR